MLAYINLYRSGFFHREGKPTAFNAHGGDIYPTEQAAKKEIHPATHYLCTVPIDCPEMVGNPPDSIPVPLSVSRKAFFRAHENEEAVHV